MKMKKISRKLIYECHIYGKKYNDKDIRVCHVSGKYRGLLSSSRLQSECQN